MVDKEIADFRKILKKRKPEFLRKDTFKKSKLGRKRKKKQKWKRPRGRHSKLREKRTGHMIQPSIGWRSPKEIRGFVQELRPKMIFNVQELNNLKEEEIAVIGKVGKKKKMEIVQEAIAKNIKLLNVNAKKFMEQVKKEQEEKAAKKKETAGAKEKTKEKSKEEKHEGKKEEKKEIKEPGKEEIKK